ncbi:MAG TPA: YceI family protein [Actinomycetes bacterium]|nr:YceI family protein [Actinomycetes bacterium]
MTTSETAPQTASQVAEEQSAENASTAGLRVVDGVALPAAGTYVLDPTHTRIGFVARHLMVTKVRGSFGEFTGSITVGEDAKGSTAEAVIKTASVDTGTADRDAHLRSDDFFASETFPDMTFGNARVTGQKGASFTVVGDLTIKDVTREVTLDVELDGVAKDPWGNEKLAVTATTEIDREDFGLTWNVALESGGVLVSKKVRIEIEAQAARQA